MKRAVLIAFCLCAAMARAQRAPESFAKGVLAFEKKEWANAEALFRDSVAGNPNEVNGTVQISGQWFETYVPHYFLARSLAKQGKCAEALREFAESERQGVTPTIPDFARHLASRDGCGGKAAPSKQPTVITEVEVPFEEGPTKKPPEKPPVKKPEVISKPPVVVVPKGPSEADFRARVERSVITDAVAAYLSGRYDETVRLASATFTDRSAAAQASLFRAAARYALYRIGGEKDEALRREVDADLSRYRELRPNGKPDPRIFPPGFIALVK